MNLETIGNNEGVILDPSSESLRVEPKRFVPGKYWCFTYNYTEVVTKEMMETCFKSYDYIIGWEVAPSTGQRHLQGYLESKKKIRPSEKFSALQGAHWEKRKGSREENILYCQKEGDYISKGFFFLRPVKDPMENLEFYPWEEDIIKYCEEYKEDRKILWIWETTGTAGKTVFAKHLGVKYGAVLCGGKAADMKYLIAKRRKENKESDIILFDIARSLEDYVSYQGIEEIKNGFFFSSKFESENVICDPPIVIVFANFKPDIKKLSIDRWDIRCIGTSEIEEVEED
nr:MAG: replication associated protein [Cressdnaviricota sp.]